MQRLKLFLIVTLATVLLLGCTQMSAEEIAKKMQEKYDSINDYKGIQRIIMEMDGKIDVFENEFVFKKPNKIWIYNKKTDTLLVSNGNKMWMYDKRNNTVTVINMTPIQQETNPDYGELVRDILEKFDVELLGSEKVSGKDCYVLKLKPKKNVIYNMSMKMWVDKEYWFPLKTQISMKGMNMTTEYINIEEFNTGISDEFFEFKPPKNAKIITQQEFGLFSSIEEAQKHVQFRILTPKYTAGCKLNSVSVINQSVHLNYINESKGSFVTIEEIPNRDIPSNFPINTKVENVKIGDTEGKYMELYGVGMVIFKEGDLLIRVSGNPDKGELIKIAESIS